MFVLIFLIFSWFADCPYLELIGDGFCNDETNSENCNYDGGDCCIDINTDYCIECICYHQDNCRHGHTPSLVDDGVCNNETNNANCYYDGGDCCKSSEIIDLHWLLILIYLFKFLCQASIKVFKAKLLGREHHSGNLIRNSKNATCGCKLRCACKTNLVDGINAFATNLLIQNFL